MAAGPTYLPTYLYIVSDISNLTPNLMAAGPTYLPTYLYKVSDISNLTPNLMAAELPLFLYNQF